MFLNQLQERVVVNRLLKKRSGPRLQRALAIGRRVTGRHDNHGYHRKMRNCLKLLQNAEPIATRQAQVHRIRSGLWFCA